MKLIGRYIPYILILGIFFEIINFPTERFFGPIFLITLVIGSFLVVFNRCRFWDIISVVLITILVISILPNFIIGLLRGFSVSVKDTLGIHVSSFGGIIKIVFLIMVIITLASIYIRFHTNRKHIKASGMKLSEKSRFFSRSRVAPDFEGEINHNIKDIEFDEEED